MSPNMTDAHLEAVMNALPDEMEESELCALTLTIYSAYEENPSAVISSLIAAIYTYGEMRGISKDRISLSLRMTADLHDEMKSKQQTNGGNYGTYRRHRRRQAMGRGELCEMIRKYIFAKTFSLFEALGISLAVGVVTAGKLTLWNLGVALTILVVMALVVAGMEARK